MMFGKLRGLIGAAFFLAFAIVGSGASAAPLKQGMPYFLNPGLLTYLVGGASGEAAALRNLNLQSALRKIGDPSKAFAAGIAADATAAAIVLVDTTNHHAAAVTLTASNAALFAYEPGFWNRAPPPPAKSLTLVVPAGQFIHVGAKYYAAAWIQVPPDGKANLAKPVGVTAKSGDGSSSGKLPLVPPPVLFLHGLWGDESSLSFTQDFMKKQAPYDAAPISTISHYLFASTYSGTAKFDSATTTDHVITEIAQQRNAVVRVGGIVAARVDVVAHSMGGLVSRSITTAPGYSSVFTRNQGAIHLIVTLDTPEAGSELATFLIDHENATPVNNQGRAFWAAVCNSENDTVAQCLGELGDPIGPAVKSLRPGDSALTKAPNPNLPDAIWRAVAAKAPKNSSLVYLLNAFGAAISPSPPPTVDSILGTADNDGIVTKASQIHGHANVHGQIAYLTGLSHTTTGVSGDGYSDAAVINSPRVNAIVLCWLKTAGGATCPNARSPAAQIAAAPTPAPGAAAMAGPSEFRADVNFSALRLQLATARYVLTPVADNGLDEVVHLGGDVDYAVVAGKDVVRVEPDGTIVGLKRGTAGVAVRYGDLTDTVDVSVE